MGGSTHHVTAAPLPSKPAVVLKTGKVERGMASHSPHVQLRDTTAVFWEERKDQEKDGEVGH